MTGTDELRYSPHFIKATATSSDLLADIEPFEQIGCAFGRVTTALVRAKLKNPHVDELEVLGATFRAVGLRERLIILSHVAKPLDTDPQGRSDHAAFIDVFDEVFVLDIDAETLERRLDERPDDEFGSAPEERALVRRLHRTQEDVPDGVRIDATRPLTQVVDDLLSRTAP